MSDTDSTADEPTEPVELPTHQAETPEQQKEFDLGFEYFHKLAKLENDLNDLNADIRSLKRPIGNPDKDLKRVLEREKKENEAAEVQREINAIRQWFTTKPANLNGVSPFEIELPPLPVDMPQTASDSLPGKKEQQGRLKRKTDLWELLRPIADALKAAKRDIPTWQEIWQELRARGVTGNVIEVTSDTVILQGTHGLIKITPEIVRNWYRKSGFPRNNGQ